MKFTKAMYTTTPWSLKYQIGEAMTVAGVPVEIGGSNQDGIQLVETTTAIDVLGVTLDAQDTVVSAQQSDNSDPARLVSVIIQPDAIYRAKLSGGATAGTDLTIRDVTTESTDGLVVTTGDNWGSPELDECMLWGFDGANAKILRKITSTGASAATLLIALPADTVVGDNFCFAPFCCSPAGMEDQFLQLTSNLAEIDGSVAVDTDNNNFRVIEIDFRDAGEEGRSSTFVKISIYDSVFTGGANV